MNDITCRLRIISTLGSAEPARIVGGQLFRIVTVKSKQNLKRSLIHQKRALVDENRELVDQKSALEGELKGIKLEPKIDECPICFESVSLERKWTAFIPCGHRTCTDCAQQISSLPRTTNCKKCPNCRETINSFLVLEGIYEF